MKLEETDPVVREVREIAMRISARFDHDPKKYFDHLRKLAEEHPNLMVSHPPGVTDDKPSKATA